MEFLHTREQLIKSGNFLVIQLQNAISKSGKHASGSLISSLKTKYSLQEGSATLELSGAPHWKFIDKGVDGTVTKYGSPYKRSDKMPPLTEVRDWMDIKGIGVGSDKTWLTFYMQKRWHEKGIKPTFLFTKEINKFRKNAEKEITKALIKDTLKEIIDGNNSNG